MNSLEVTDQEAQVVAVAPRVTLQSIEDSIKHELIFTGNQTSPTAIEELKTLTICILVMKNGFTVIGKAAPAAPENFNEELGKKFAREDAIRQLWPLMGFALREKLAAEA